MSELIKEIEKADETIAKLILQKNLVLEKAIQSSDVDTIYKASQYIQSLQQERTQQAHKALLIDPMAMNLGAGYVQKNTELSFDMLRRMSRVHVIKSIIDTRIEQILSFCQPQADRFSTGFKIRPKKVDRSSEVEKKVTTQQQKEIDYLTDFILNCGEDKNKWYGDYLEDFMKKWLQDSLALDQAPFEVVCDRKQKPHEFLAVDGATCAIADSWRDNQQKYFDFKEIDGYVPFYVQVYMNKIIAQFYPWELCFGIRHPQSNIYSFGYGRSELEDLIRTVTAILNADSYNMNYFTVGSNPKGILRVTGNVNTSRLEEFRMQWQSQMAGVRNAHKLPIIEADKMDFVSTQASNKDMEYGHWVEFLIKISCAVYLIDPSEIGFPMQGGMEQKSMFEGSNEARLKHSKDKGLRPLLRFVEKKFNRYLIQPLSNFLSDDYVFEFVGLNSENAKEELEADIQKVQNFVTLNEIRRKWGYEDIPEGDIVLNPMYTQAIQMATMNAAGQGEQNQESNAYVDSYNEQENGGEEKGGNPIMKALNHDINKLLTSK